MNEVFASIKNKKVNVISASFFNCIIFHTVMKEAFRRNKETFNFIDKMILSHKMGVSGISIISFLDFISIKAFSDFAVIQ